MNKILFMFSFLIINHFHSRSDELVDILSEELQRNFDGLTNESRPPYYIAYGLTNVHSANIVSTGGKILRSIDTEQRILDIDLRVGSYDFDNTHIIRGQSFSFGSPYGAVVLPLENIKEAIAQKIWLATDREYKTAIERYEKALSNKAVKIKEDDLSGDLTHEKAIVNISEEQYELNLDKSKWEDKLNQLSNKFSEHPWILSAQVSLSVENKTKYFVGTDGTKLKWTETAARIMVYAKTKADDGMSLPLYNSYFAFSAENLPNVSKISKDIDSLILTLDKLRSSPIAETYSGPAILSGEAAGVFFHEIFGHRVEGHREKDPNSSQMFKKMVGKDVLPDFIDVVFDPTRKKLRDREISGYFPFDDQGIKSQKVVSVESGKFKSFLMSRSPIENFPVSNGHGRRQQGRKAVSRQSNLIVETSKTVTLAELRSELIKECKKQDKDYGLMFDVVQGGFTFTSRTIPNAFNVMPLVVYKIFTDGRPDELVRGVDLIGTPLATFRNIMATADDLGIFNGVCGAESGGVPVSACSPSLLISNIEIQKKRKSQSKLPLLPPPPNKFPINDEKIKN